MKEFKLHSKPKEINYGYFYKKLSCINMTHIESTFAFFKKNLKEALDKIVEKDTTQHLNKSQSSELSEEEFNLKGQSVDGYFQKVIALTTMQMVVKEIVEIENAIKEKLNELLQTVDADIIAKSDYSHLLKQKKNRLVEQKTFQTFLRNNRTPISELDSSNSSTSFSFTKKQGSKEDKVIVENETPLFKLKSDSDKFCSKTTADTYQNKQKNVKNNTVFNLPQVKLELSSKEQPDFVSSPNQFIREITET